MHPYEHAMWKDMIGPLPIIPYIINWWCHLYGLPSQPYYWLFNCWSKISECHNFFIWHRIEGIQASLESGRWKIWLNASFKAFRALSFFSLFFNLWIKYHGVSNFLNNLWCWKVRGIFGNLTYTSIVAQTTIVVTSKFGN